MEVVELHVKRYGIGVPKPYAVSSAQRQGSRDSSRPQPAQTHKKPLSTLTKSPTMITGT